MVVKNPVNSDRLSVYKLFKWPSVNINILFRILQTFIMELRSAESVVVGNS